MSAEVHSYQEVGIDTWELEICLNRQSPKQITVTDTFQIPLLVLRGDGEIEKGKTGEKKDRHGL